MSRPLRCCRTVAILAGLVFGASSPHAFAQGDDEVLAGDPVTLETSVPRMSVVPEASWVPRTPVMPVTPVTPVMPAPVTPATVTGSGDRATPLLDLSPLHVEAELIAHRRHREPDMAVLAR